jgi:two-component system, OmpR family, sensor histidine kinase BaeS
VARLERLGLRARLALALVATAVLAVGTATVLSNVRLPTLVDEAAEARLGRQAAHLAAVAAAFHEEDGGWTVVHVRAVEHLAATSGLAIEIEGGGGAGLLTGRLPPHGSRASVPVLVRGGRVGTLAVQPAGRDLLTAEEAHLRHSLDRLHLVAGALSVLAALALAFVLAQGLARPLRRIRRGAERIAGGELETRLAPGGGPELAAVAGALNRLAETLAREEELRKESVADLAHELRTPVNGLLGRIEAAQDGILPAEENLAAMHDEIVRLTRLLDDLGRLADAERPGLLVAKAELDLADLARLAGERWRPRAESRELALDVAAAPAPVLGDRGRLVQVLDNLLANAVAYGRPGGRVVVRTAARDGEALLEVEDDGVGIREEDLPHVFERFWRGDRSRSRETGGTGIGLAIAAELVRAHDGRIEVESAPGRGSTFRVVVPRADARPDPSPQRHEGASRLLHTGVER